MAPTRRDLVIPLIISTLALAFFPTKCEGLKIDPEEEEMIVPVGASFELRCEGDTPVEWAFPTPPNEDSTHNGVKDPPKNSKTHKVMVATYLHTGFYTCSEPMRNIEKKIYVFIRDLDHLLVGSSNMSLLSLSSSEDLVIPCKPSFPEVNVTLMPSGNEKMVLVGYDNKHGFKIRISETMQLLCVGSFQTYSMVVKYEVEHEMSSDSLESPEIELIDHDPHKHILLGQNVSLKCYVSTLAGIHLDLLWEHANHNRNNIIIGETSIKRKYDHAQPLNWHERTLTILNVQKANEGDYKCEAQDSQYQTAESTFTMRVFDDTNKYLNITHNGPSIIVSRLGKSEVVLMANIAAHPSPQIAWLNPMGKIIESDGKYNIIVNMDNTHLTINQPTTEDSGEYILNAQNDAGAKILRYTLNVEGYPKLKISASPGAALLRTKKNITCSVVGFPTPSVTMVFHPCSRPHNCSSSFLTLGGIRNSCKSKISSTCNYTATLPLTRLGNVTCMATNRVGSKQISLFIHTTDVPDDFYLFNSSIGDGTISDLDTIKLTCVVSKFIYTANLVWELKKSKSEHPQLLQPKDGVVIHFNETELSYWSTLTITKPKVTESGKYMCKATTQNNTHDEYRITNILVERSYAPTFMGASNNSDSEFSLKSQAIWLCNVTGMPTPQITWYKNGKVVVSDARHLKGDHNKSLTISFLDYTDEGTYKCLATNKKGEASLIYHLKIIRPGIKSGVQWLIFIAALVLLLLCFIFVLYQRKKLKKEKKTNAGYYDPEGFFTSGGLECINPDIDISEQANFLPYDQNWELPRDKIRFIRSKPLGQGAFGLVKKAEVIGLRNDEEKTIVAVKTVKEGTDLSLIQMLASELKIMANLGQHVNVVNLLGACTKNIPVEKLLVVVEFCKYGNLHHYLLTHRNNFINQVNPGSGNMDIIPSESSIGFPVSVSKSNSNYKGASEYDSADSNCQTMTTDMSLLSTPVGEDGYLLSKEAVSQHYLGDFNQSEKRTVSTQDLLCYAFQIAKGMEYLASRKVLHGDLASRNVLLAENNVVKICDFGFAKSVYKTGVYNKMVKQKDLLPIKWMSIEALEDRVFSIQSDLWAFGIVLWELFSLSKTPYPGIQPSDILSLLKDGYRMEKPDYSTEDVYNLMVECWNVTPMLRPPFTECAERLGNMLEESVKQHYIDLNNPYAEFNSQHASGRDYLSILKPPTYVNCVTSNHHEGEAVNEYVSMHHNQNYKKKEGKEGVELTPMLPQPGDTSIFNPGYQGLSHVVACTN